VSPETATREGTVVAALLAALAGLCVLGPVFWVIGILQFGLIVGRDPTPALVRSNLLWTSIVGIPLFALLLRTIVRSVASRSFGFASACFVAAVALSPVQAAIYRVTLYQRGDDTVVVLVAFALALGLLVLLTSLLARDARAGAGR
jgi:hypothetical protein